MAEDKNNLMKNLEYRQFIPAEDFFDNAAQKESLELSKNFSLGGFFHFFMNKIQLGLLKFAEYFLGTKIFVVADEFLLLDLSAKTKKIMTELSRQGIIKKITKEQRIFNDEPEIIRYRSDLADNFPKVSLYSDGLAGEDIAAGGADLNEERAILKTVGEAVERFCTCVYREKNLLLSSYDKIGKKALNPLDFAGISLAWRKKNPEFKIDENSLFRWVQGFSLHNKKEVFIPAQLVYIGYRHHQKEPIIYQQITTGAAANDSFFGALYRGICEAVERDAFIITYLNRLSPPLIEADNIEDEEIQKFLSKIRRYNLEPYLIDMTTDIVVPSVMAIIIDRTGKAQAVSVGTSADLEIKEAIKGSILEAIRSRNFSFRKMFFSDSRMKEEAIKRRKELESDFSRIKTFSERFLFWSPLEMIEKIDFLFKGRKKQLGREELNKYQDFSIKEKLKAVLNFLKEKNIDIYGVDITLPQIKKSGLYVVKVVSPQLQPLYLDERLKCLGGGRLYRVPVILGYRQKPLLEEEFNPIPHPFL